MDIKQCKHRKTYSKEFKLRAVKMNLEQNYSKPVIQKQLGISKSMIERWVKQYQLHGETGLEDHRGKMSTGRPRLKEMTEVERLQAKIRRLEMENAILKKYREVEGRGVDSRQR